MANNDKIMQSLLAFKLRLARSLMLGLVIVCSIGLPISLIRWFSIGFQAIFIVHICVTVLAFIFCFKKNKGQYKVDMFVIVCLLTLMVISGVFSFGLQSGAMAFSIFCTFIIAIGWGLKAASVYAVAWCLFVMSSGYLHIHNYIVFEVSPTEYSNTMGSWSIVAVGSSMIIIFMLMIAKQAFEYFYSLVEQIEQQKQEIELLANQDSMTGCLSNRLTNPTIDDALASANKAGSKLALLFIDLNKFKCINDTYGHHTGDEVLIAFSSRIKSVLKGVDTLFRIGGDEFLLLLPNIQGKEEVSLIAQRIVDTWKPPFYFDEHKLLVTGSIGIALYPQDGEQAEELREKADAAMYKAKQEAKGFHFYCSSDIRIFSDKQ